MELSFAGRLKIRFRSSADRAGGYAPAFFARQDNAGTVLRAQGRIRAAFTGEGLPEGLGGARTEKAVDSSSKTPVCADRVWTGELLPPGGEKPRYGKQQRELRCGRKIAAEKCSLSGKRALRQDKRSFCGTLFLGAGAFRLPADAETGADELLRSRSRTWEAGMRVLLRRTGDRPRPDQS